MTINGINGVNKQVGQMGMNQATDPYSRNIQNQIANAQKQLQELSFNEDMTLEEKMKKRQEIQQQISDLNMQLRQHQMEQRREKQQAKGSSMDDMLGGNRSVGNKKSGNNGAGLSQASMTSLISADNSMKQAKVQGSVSSQFEGKAGVLEIEIKLDESRAVNGLAANTEGKKAELAEVEQKAMDAAATQMETLGDINKSLEEANKADEQSDKADKKSTQPQAKDEENISGTDEQEETVSVAEKGNAQLDGTPQQPATYSPIDVRL